MQPAVALADEVRIGRRVRVARQFGGVRVAAQELAELHLVAVVDDAVLGRVEHRVRTFAVNKAEVFHRLALVAEVPHHRLHRQQHHARVPFKKFCYGAEQCIAGFQCLTRAGLARTHAQLHDHMDGRQLDQGCALRCVPVAHRQPPASRVVEPEVTEQAGARLHALLELLWKQRDLRLRQAHRTQALAGEGDVQERLARIERAAFPGDAGMDRIEKLRCGRRAVECQQQQAAVGHVRVGTQDATLHVCRGIGLRGAPGQRRRGTFLGFLQQPVDLLRKPDAPTVHHLVQFTPLVKVDELLQQITCGALQEVAVWRARQEVVGQAMHERERAQALAPQLLDDMKVCRADARPGQLFGALHRLPCRHQVSGQTAGHLAVREFLMAQGLNIIDRQARHGIEEVGLDLDAAHPFGPFLEAVAPGTDIALGVAEDDVQQGADALPEHPQIRFPTAVEGHRQQHLVRFDHGHAHRLDLPHPLDTIGKRAQQRILVRRASAVVQGLEQALDACLVGQGLQ